MVNDVYVLQYYYTIVWAKGSLLSNHEQEQASYHS